MEKRRDYTACLPENTDWCMPSALQTVLKTRGIEISQRGITGYFSQNADGYVLDNTSLRNFLGRFNLRSEFFNPFTEPYGNAFNWKEIDETLHRFMEKRGEDLLVSYNHLNKSGGHVAIVSGFDLSTRLVRLINSKEKILLPELLDAMHPGDLRVSGDSNRGFYVIQ